MVILYCLAYQLAQSGGRAARDYVSSYLPQINFRFRHPCKMPLLNRIIDCPEHSVAVHYMAPINYTELLDFQVEKLGELRDKGLVSKNIAKQMYHVATRDVWAIQNTLKRSSLSNKSVLLEVLDKFREKMEASGRHLQLFHASVTQEIFT
ncbi:MAG TPA: hypothetical protein VGO47_12950 [Chlamydiales bacterium]|nr:hypothetical protein [Chlamydiales bacterium]